MVKTENSDAGLTRAKMSHNIFYVCFLFFLLLFSYLGEPLLAGTAQVSGYLNTFIIGILGSLAFST